MATQTTQSSLDELAKGLATGTLSRGKALRWMGGALLGAALASVPGVAWANDCRRLGRECRRDSQCCSKNCVRRGDNKVCGCPEGKKRCGDRCVNLNRNENHCGECFNRCAPGEECDHGVCGGGCTANGGDCSDPSECCGGFCDESGRCCSGECTTDTDCCGDNICDSVGLCVPPGLNRLVCFCNDGDVSVCIETSCNSPEIETMCLDLNVCAEHGGGGEGSNCQPADCACQDASDCDDGDPCTVDSCVDGLCVHTPMDCDDNNECTRDFCVDGMCMHEPIVGPGCDSG